MIIETFKRIFFIQSNLPKTAQIEITNRCNLDCKMCPREHIDIEYKDMELETYKKVVDKLKGVSEIILMGWGEPFIHPDIIEIVRYSHNAGFKTRTTSNAVLLTDKKIDEIVESGLDEITFSIDGISSSEFGHPLTTQVENIKSFYNKYPLFPITLQTTIYKDGEENIFDIIRLAKEINAKVNIGRLDIRFYKGIKRPDFKEEKAIVKRLVKFGDKQGVIIGCMYHTLDKGIKRFVYKLIKRLLHQCGRYCLRIHDYIYVDVYGNVIPCGYLMENIFGSLLKEDLKTIWQRAKKFQNKTKDVCNKCDMFKMKQNV